MTFTTLLDADITVVTRADAGTTTPYGSPEYTETTELVKGRFWPVESVEAPDGAREAEVWGVMLDASVAIDAHAVLEVDGDRYEVIGPPKPFANPRTGLDHHLELRVRRTS